MSDESVMRIDMSKWPDGPLSLARPYGSRKIEPFAFAQRGRPVEELSRRTFIQLTRAWYAARELKDAKFVEEFNFNSTENEFQIRWYDFSNIEAWATRRPPLRMEVVVWYDTLGVYEDFGDLFIALLEWRKTHKRDEPPQPSDVLAMLRRLGIEDDTPAAPPDTHEEE